MNSLIWFLIIGAIAGWLAGLLMKGRGFGILGDIVVGIVGAVLGGWLFGVLGISAGGGLAGSLIVAFIGAVILLFLVRLIKRSLPALRPRERSSMATSLRVRGRCRRTCSSCSADAACRCSTATFTARERSSSIRRSTAPRCPRTYRLSSKPSRRTFASGRQPGR